MTVKTNYVVAATTSAPYSTTATSTGNVGDVLICSAASYEFSSASPGSRTLAMATAGWTQLNLEEFQVYPTFPVYANRRTHLATWWKIATSTSDTVTVTLSGASEAFLGLWVGVNRIVGIPNPTVVDQGPATKRDNVDLGVNPASTWTHAPSAATPSQVSLLVRCSLFNGGSQPPTGYAFPAHSSGGGFTPYLQMAGGGTVSTYVYWRMGAPSLITFANTNSSDIVSSLTLDFDYPVLTHTGAMTT